MKHWMNVGVEQIRALSKPKRIVLIAALWCLTVAVVSLAHSLVSSVLSVSIATATIWLIQPYLARHPDKGVIELGRSLLDFRRPSGYEISLAVVGVGVIIAGEILFALVIGVLAVDDPAGHGIATTAQSSSDLATIAFFFLVAAAVAPVMEELVFRNGIQKLLAYRVGDIGAIVVTSTLFASLHIPAYGGFDVPMASLALPLSVVFTGSVVFGVLYWRTRNVAVPMLSHCLFNGVVLLYTVAEPPIFG